MAHQVKGMGIMSEEDLAFMNLEIACVDLREALEKLEANFKELKEWVRDNGSKDYQIPL
uniref:Uncharacterized protein n=1 Tax=viral metagenome TaxID=1070528 RepID=A0A6M3LED7_9ZZZZ